uniref:Protein-tyrosine phosphatase n=1 Tax=Ascaris lumbricoides TaxID=6252 RepID=A0A0M3I3K9_ASCLU
MVYGPKRTYLHDEPPSPNLPSSTASPVSRSYLDVLRLDETRVILQGRPKENDYIHANWVACCHGGLRALVQEFPSVRKFIPNVLKLKLSIRTYLDVLRLDETRVILQGRPKENDYIQANWVVLPSKANIYAHKRHLMKRSKIFDLWSFRLQEKVTAIIMLCDVVEGGESKCAEYYPTANGKELTFGSIKVKNIHKGKPIETIICFTLSVEMSAIHKLLHYKWAEWPDRAAPASVSPMVELLRKTKPMFTSEPIVVHCSVGIGRTGTYCAVDYTIDQLVVKEIRKQRLHSVQIALRYLYLHNCLVEYLIVRKAIQRDANVKKLLRDYEKYLKKYNERNAKASYIN